MSENNSSHIDMLADSVGSDTCQYSWFVRVCSIYSIHDMFYMKHETLPIVLDHVESEKSDSTSLKLKQ